MSLVDHLRALDTPSVSDALDALGLSGAVPGLQALGARRRIAGPVVTVQLAYAEDVPPATPGAPKRHLCTAAVAASSPGDVIVVAHPGDRAAGWGGLLTRAAQLRGVEGTLVDGPARDVDESRELGYPVYARTATPVTARGRIAELRWNAPVSFGGVTVRPGDLVLADGSGVVFVPADRADDVVAKACALADREAAMARDLQAGHPVTEVMGRTYEQLAGQGINSDH